MENVNTNSPVAGYAATAVQTWTVDMAAIKDRRSKLSDKYGTSHMVFVANLVCYAAAGWFIRGDRAAYSDKLGTGFTGWLIDNCKMGEKQAQKYSSVVSGSLHIRKTKADQRLIGLRLVALNEGPDGVLGYLDNLGLDSFNKFVAAVQPGTNPAAVDRLLKQVAGLPEELRDIFMAKIKGAIADKRSADEKAAHDKAQKVIRKGAATQAPAAS